MFTSIQQANKNDWIIINFQDPTVLATLSARISPKGIRTPKNKT